jgi:hypothetical protein
MLCGMSRLRAVPIATVVVAVALLLAGCHPTSGPSGSPTASPTSSTSATPTPTPTPTATDTADCSANQLQIVYGATDGSAGHAHGVLTFGNLGQTDCILTGYSTVSFQNPTTLQPMGPAAVHDPSESAGPADASVDGFSTADLTITDASIVGGCTIVTATALLVTPPGMSHQFVVPVDPTQACSNDVGLLSVSSNYIPDGS